jgi:transcriptional regulator with XRE-family HTH domain
MKQQYHVGIIIKELISEKKLSVTIIAKRMGVNRQNVYNALNKHTMTVEELEKYAKAFEIDISEIESRIKVLNKPEIDTVETEYLKELFKKLEKSLREIIEKQSEHILNLEESLKSKDNQINTLIGLLGGAK